MENGIQLINLSEIRTNNLNPRKTFNEASIVELSESIKNVGVLQPIIVRPIPDKKTKFEIVCGERRYRASLLAGIDTIPVIVKALTDADAFELMITENLQREDVKPLEEAEAYLKMINKMKYQISELCVRFGKSETYIRHRLKLNDLIPDFRNLLEIDTINISMALEICKLEDKYQRDLYDSFYTEEHNYAIPKTLSDLKYKIGYKFTNLLSSAKFSITSDEFTHAGACDTCLKNTACNGLLFPEEPENGRCMDKDCFDEKSKQHIVSLAKIIQNTEPGILIIEQRYGNSNKEFISELVDNGIDVCKFPDNHFIEKQPKTPKMPEAPVKTDFENDEEYEDALIEFEDMMADYENELNNLPTQLAEFESDVASGKFRKALIVTGPDSGDIVYLKSYSTTQMSGSHVNGAANTAEVNMKSEIIDLEMKDKRNFELSFDKSYQQVKDIIFNYDEKDSGKVIFENEKGLSNNENDAMILFMTQNCGHNQYVLDIYTSLGYKGHYFHGDISLEIVQKLTIAQKNIIKRAWLMHQIKNTLAVPINELDKLFIEIVKENYPDQVNQILLDEQGKYLKKKEIINKKIEEIEIKLIKSVTKSNN